MSHEPIIQTAAAWVLTNGNVNGVFVIFRQLNVAKLLADPDSYRDAKHISQLGISETGIAISTEAYYF